MSRIWADVELVDCRKSYPKGSAVFQDAARDPGGLPDKIFEENPSDYLDDHDDTPIIRKLIILARFVRKAVNVLGQDASGNPNAEIHESPPKCVSLPIDATFQYQMYSPSFPTSISADGLCQ